MRITLVTAELSPLVKVGGLADAVSGLRKALFAAGHTVATVLPDYSGWELAEESTEVLSVPDWVGRGTARTGKLSDGSAVTLIAVPGIARTHPYDDPDGRGWPDNDQRFFRFAAAAAAHVMRHPPDVVHLHDWHAGAVLGFLPDAPPSVLTIHNLAYQGRAGGEWLERLTNRPDAYEWFGDMNPLSGAITLAERIVTVSPTFAAEIVADGGGFGLEGLLRLRAGSLSGIINGLDTEVWDPANDPLLPAHFKTLAGKATLRAGLLQELGWAEDLPLISMVTRLTDQKGVDFALTLVTSLAEVGARLVLLGSGDQTLAAAATALSAGHPGHFRFLEGYDEPMAHLLFAGSDLYLMPSRFEPCGLAQMQAMRYGTIPVATAVGGLVDTIIDDDAHRGSGTGFLAARPTADDVLAGVRRATVAWHSPRRRTGIQRRGMEGDWSWGASAAAYIEAYRSAIG